ncbi:MAG: hypothetical protein M1837_006999 [Sclerophora amabilis]|nr:MAG: hypothetical protein M1837_006999 [Sclerophora amabilis]
MPSKIQLDENLWFLYICLKKSDYKAIDFNGVGDVTGLKAPAARMRYTRLRRAIESGTLIGTRGTPFQSSAERIVDAQKKRKRSPHISPLKEEATEPEQEDMGVLETRSGSRFSRNHPTEPYTMDDMGSDEDSDDDLPLAKRSSSAESQPKPVVGEEVKSLQPDSGSSQNVTDSLGTANAYTTTKPGLKSGAPKAMPQKTIYAEASFQCDAESDLQARDPKQHSRDPDTPCGKDARVAPRVVSQPRGLAPRRSRKMSSISVGREKLENPLEPNDMDG